MRNLKNRLTASIISLFVVGSSCLSTVFADPPKRRKKTTEVFPIHDIEQSSEPKMYRTRRYIRLFENTETDQVQDETISTYINRINAQSKKPKPPNKKSSSSRKSLPENAMDDETSETIEDPPKRRRKTTEVLPIHGMEQSSEPKIYRTRRYIHLFEDTETDQVQDETISTYINPINAQSKKKPKSPNKKSSSSRKSLPENAMDDETSETIEDPTVAEELKALKAHYSTPVLSSSTDDKTSLLHKQDIAGKPSTKKPPKPPRSEHKEELRKPLKSTIGASDLSECINVLPSLPKAASHLPSIADIPFELPLVPSQKVNISRANKPEMIPPFPVRLIQNPNESYNDFSVLRLDPKTLKDPTAYVKYIDDIESIIVKRLNSADFRVSSFSSSDYLNEKNCLCCPSSSTTVSDCIYRIVDDIKERKDIFKEVYEKSKRFSVLQLSDVFRVSPEVKEYVTYKYISNGDFFNSSRELCPSVTSYIKALSGGIPDFMKTIMKNVEQYFKCQKKTIPDSELLELLKCLYSTFFRTFLFRIFHKNLPSEVREGRIVKYIGNVELDFPATSRNPECYRLCHLR